MVRSPHLGSRAGWSLLVLWLSLSMSGCGSPGTLQKPDDDSSLKETTIDRPVSRRDCTVVERDLTLAWDRRVYWCIPEQASIRLPIHDVVRGRAAYHMSKPPSIEARVETSDRVHGLIHHTQTKDEQDGKKTQKIRQYTIPFAHGLQVLGPQGQAKVQALYPEAKTARRIELRGGTVEVGSKAWKDEFAVGRASAVRKRLIEGGVERDKIRIRHRDADEKARAVGVVLYE